MAERLAYWQALNRALREGPESLRTNCCVVILFAGFYLEANLNYIAERLHMTHQMRAFLNQRHPGLQDKLAWFYNEFVARSNWVTILPSVISVNDIDRGELIVNPIVDPELHAEFVVIQATRRKLSTQARMFLQRFEAEVANIHDIWDRAIAGPERRLRA